MPTDDPRSNMNESGATKTPKILSCMLCQQRKIKCNKGSPCSNCQKLRVECIPTAPLSRPRKRRFAEAELLARLRRYEDLLRSYGANIDDLRGKDPVRDVKSEPEQSIEDTGSNSFENSKLEDLSIVDTEEQGEQEPAEEWRETKRELVATEEMLRGAPEDGIDESPFTTTLDTVFTNNEDGLLLESHENSIDMVKLHPTPILLFRLWQTFLDRVYPIYKVFHAPTIQQQIFEAASDLQNISKGFEALLFSIYCSAVKSLSRVDCNAMFGEDKLTLLARFQLGARKALGNAGFLRTSDLTVLQALVLYLPTLYFKVDPRSIFSLTGLAVRIAQRMGLQRDPRGVLPFEAEIRRRLWWHIVLIDDQMAELSGSGTSILLHRWSTRLPLNINDGELYADMREPPVERHGPTEMILFLSRCEIADLLRKIQSQPKYDDKWFELSTSAVSVATKDKAIDNLEETLENKYLKFCEKTVPVQCLTEILARSTICDLRLKVHHPRLLADRGAAMSWKEKDKLFSWGVKKLEYHVTAQTMPTVSQFLWFTNMNAPMLGYIYVLNELRFRTTGELADEGWRQVEISIASRRTKFQNENLPVVNKSPMNMALSNMIVKAWDARHAACPHLPVPQFITDMRRELPEKKWTGVKTASRGQSTTLTAHPDALNGPQQFHQANLALFDGDASGASWMPVDEMMDLTYWDGMMSGSDMPLEYFIADQQGY